MKNIVIDNQVTTYQINEDGDVFNTKTKKWLVGQANYKNGYWSVNLSLGDGIKKRKYIHRLVALTYLGEPDDPNKTEVNHKDGNKNNNNVNNLEWVSPQQNQQHAIETCLRTFKPVYCFNDSKELIHTYRNAKEAADDCGCCESIILQELNKDIKTLTYGMYWSYKDYIDEIKNYKNTGKSKVVYQYDLDGNFIAKYSSTGEAGRALGLKTFSHIGECCRNKIKTYKGFIWRYEEDIVSTSDESQREVLNVTS